MLKIKVAIVDADTAYLERLVGSFNDKYGSNLTVGVFGSYEAAADVIMQCKYDVVLLAPDFAEHQNEIPAKCAVGYMVNGSFDTVNGIKAIRKYQRIDGIYDGIRELYEEKASKAGAEISIAGSTDSTIVLFAPVSGGVGSSTVAAACALSLARRGRSVLYLNLEDFGTSQTYFSAEGNGSLEDVMLALKMKTVNVGMKIKEAIKTDQSGVSFLESPRKAGDIVSLAPEKVEPLLTAIVNMKTYQHIIVDVSLNMNERTEAFLTLANRKYFVCNGTQVSNDKLKRMVEYFGMKEQKDEKSLLNNTFLLYNDFHKATGKRVEGLLPLIGGLPHHNVDAPRDLAESLSNEALFNTLVE